MRKKTSSKNKSSSKAKGSWRQIASVWENQGRDGTFLSVTVNGNNQYSPGKLLWVDETTGNVYQVKNMNVYEVQASGDRLPLQNLSINLDNDKQCILVKGSAKAAPKPEPEEEVFDEESLNEEFSEDFNEEEVY